LTLFVPANAGIAAPAAMAVTAPAARSFFIRVFLRGMVLLD
jgi:hypothetical protein